MNIQPPILIPLVKSMTWAKLTHNLEADAMFSEALTNDMAPPVVGVRTGRSPETEAAKTEQKQPQTMAGFRRSTLTEGLELLLGLEPMDILPTSYVLFLISCLDANTAEYNSHEAPKPADLTGNEVDRDPEDDLEAFMERREHIYRQRRERVQKVCQLYGSKLHRTTQHIIDSFMVSKKNGIGMCRHGKVGTTTWLVYFFDMSPLSSYHTSGALLTGKILHSKVPKMFEYKVPKGKKIGLQVKEDNLLTVSTVRHPFERLVSAYENKLMDTEGSMPTYIDLAARIEKEYGSLSFSNFVKFLQMDYSSNCSLRSCYVDVHWRPFYERCGFCDIDYDVIGYLDEFEEDAKYLGLKLNLTNIFKTDLKFNARKRPEDDRTLKYFRELDHDTKVELYKFLKVDFELFGFSPAPYL
eukprot:maker-scaffold1297_size49794-snap-gene-0.7 protein:Tk03836 transcript:maker-scaffold1297_size49794-snap-gene-0.7-mRNA-1 annotation:"carbohydrate sulfotransferase 11-like"